MANPAFLIGCGVTVSLALLLAGGTGCAVVEELGMAKPAASLKDVNFLSATLDAASLAFDVEIENPYSVDLPLSDLDYSLASAGRKFLTGVAELQDSIPAKSSKVISIPVTVNFLDLLEALDDTSILSEAIPYNAELGIVVDTPLTKGLRLPMTREGTLAIPEVSRRLIDEQLGRMEWSGPGHGAGPPQHP